MNNELNKKLAEWADLIEVREFTEENRDGNFYQCKAYVWKETKERITFSVEQVGFYAGFPPFTESLDACFKWLLSGLPRWELSYEYYLTGMVFRAKVWAKDGIRREAGHKLSPALALCLAISKLIEQDVDKSK